jgi:hypothetical protein
MVHQLSPDYDYLRPPNVRVLLLAHARTHNWLLVVVRQGPIDYMYPNEREEGEWCRVKDEGHSTGGLI